MDTNPPGKGWSRHEERGEKRTLLRAGIAALLVECLPSINGALGTVPSTT